MVVRFLLFLLFGFSTLHAQEVNYKLIWEDGKAKKVEIIFPDDLQVNADNLTVNVMGAERPIFGKKVVNNNTILFSPIIPFTHGLTYQVRLSTNLILSFEVVSDSEQPSVSHIFPKADTVPENLLKLYIVFDQSMGEGRAEDNIKLFKNGEEIKDAFLALQPELWNKNIDILTIWIDPGRVKRDLKRNQKLGQVLNKGNSYKLVVGEKMISKEGKELKESYEKTFYVTGRDEIKPDIQDWSIQEPAVGTTTDMIISFNEPLDYQVVVNSLKLMRYKEEVKGVFATQNDTQITFTPSTEWSSGDYQLVVESRIEDLAGNNLNRLFDRDLTKKARYEPKEYFYLSFEITE